MVRQLYIILLALHPAPFRYRFGLEMLTIFDEASAQGGMLPLLVDAVHSLVRQWLRPYRPKAAAGAGGPAFCLIETSQPEQRYLVAGATLSLLLFSLLTTSISRGEGRFEILVGAFHSRPGLLSVDRNSILPSGLTTEVRVPPLQAAAGSYTESALGALRGSPQLLRQDATSAPLPEYPESLLWAGKHGIVIAELVVSPEGRIKEALVLASFDHRASAAVGAALSNWQFHTTRELAGTFEVWKNCVRCVRTGRLGFKFQIVKGRGMVLDLAAGTRLWAASTGAGPCLLGNIRT